MSEFRMPSLGADMEAGKLVAWLRQPGEQVKRGDIIAVVETQKGAIEVEIFEDGIVERLLVTPGQTVPVGTPLALIATTAPRPMGAVPAKPATPPAPAAAAPPTAAPLLARGPGQMRASPAARRLAQEHGLALAGIVGTGPDGTVIAADVERAAAAKPAPPPAQGIDPAAMRRAIAAAMARSKREIPHYYLTATIEVSRSVAWLASYNASRPPTERLLPPVLFLKAVALALRKFPEFNGFHTEAGFEHREPIHVGMAVSLRGGGLVAPAIHDTDRRTLDDLMTAFRDLVLRVRAGTLRSSELSDPTITVSSLGERGVDVLLPVIYPPQVAIVGFGTVVERPWVVDGAVVARPVTTASLAGDHRVSDGHRGALFLREIETLLQQPEGL